MSATETFLKECMGCFCLNLPTRATIVQEKSKNKLLLESTVLPLLHWLGETEVDIDELECITANLIYNGFIKGNNTCSSLTARLHFTQTSMLSVEHKTGISPFEHDKSWVIIKHKNFGCLFCVHLFVAHHQVFLLVACRTHTTALGTSKLFNGGETKASTRL